jgi:arginine repressor
MAVVSTLDPGKAYLEIRISPGCEQLISELLDSLREEGLEIVQKK